MEYDHFIDIKDMCCFAPVIHLTEKFKYMKLGDIVLIKSNKVSMLTDIPSYCSLTNNELIQQEDNDGIFCFWVKIR